MANEFRTLESHSAEYFGDTRDYWWNLDFLELIGKRLSFDRVQDALDVGSGVGHWGQMLAKVIPSTARVHGVDREPLWVEKAAARAAAHGLADRFKYQVGVAERLPFADASFDLVTCQTVLIHTLDPGAAIDEMVRVARPGGLILAAEPNNVARALMLDSVSFHDPVDEILARVRFQLVCERGKAALGEGNNSIGDLVPSLLAERELVDIRVYLNDKADILLPPYDSPAQRAMLQERADFKDRDFWIWSRQDTHRYFLAGGGCESEFDALWLIATGGNDKFDKAIADLAYAGAGAGRGRYRLPCSRQKAMTSRRSIARCGLHCPHGGRVAPSGCDPNRSRYTDAVRQRARFSLDSGNAQRRSALPRSWLQSRAKLGPTTL
jgi:ubiquinone/menaquinone biosynthesis C-methylase UbiE